MVIETFLADRSLSHPDGRRLYAYRCSAVESERFREFLIANLSDPTARIGPKTAQSFCLWAADYWRRTHSQGAWSWSPVLEALNAEYLGPGQPGYGKLQKMVTEGLKSWGLAVLPGDRRTHYLITLACEGGLPLQLVVREQANLRSYFHALMTEYQLHLLNGSLARGVTAKELAKRVDFHLPKSLRNEIVVGLSADLVQVIAHYSKKVLGAADPIAALDLNFREWREQMPLDLSDDVARAFLRGLVEDAVTIASQPGPKVGWRRSIRKTAATPSGNTEEVPGEDWELTGRLDLPSIVQQQAFETLFSGLQISGKFDLLLLSGDAAAEPVAFGTTRATTKTISLDKLRGSTKLTRGASAAAERQLLFRGQRGAAAETTDFVGAHALSDLPWVFAASSHSEPGHYDYLGEGSVRTRASDALVAYPSSFKIEVEGDSACTEIGRINDYADRRIVRVSGTVRFVDSFAARCSVTTGVSANAERTEYRLSGKRGYVGRDSTARFFGAPALYIEPESGVPRRVESREMQWRSALPGSRWLTCSAESRGDGYIRYARGGEILFQSRISVLSSDFAINVIAGESSDGVIEIRGAADAEVAVVDHELKSVATLTNNMIRLGLQVTGTPPAAVRVRLLWPLRGESTLTLPYPGNDMGFWKRSGGRLNAETHVAVTQLSRYRATAMVPKRFADFRVEGSYLRTNMSALNSRTPPRLIMQDMIEVVGGFFELDLSRLQGQITRLLNSDDDLDGVVRLKIASNSVQHLTNTSLYVNRYDLQLTHDNLMGLQLAPEALSRMTQKEIDSLVLRAFPIHEPNAEPIVLPRISPIAWNAPKDLLAGPWIVSGWDGAWCRVRPMIFVVDGEFPQPREHSLPSAVLEPTASRMPSILKALDAISADPDHEDWSLLLGYLRWVDDFPASTFDTLKAIAKRPDVCALMSLVVLERDPGAFDRMWRAMETLPFSWNTLPRNAWSHAVACWLSARQKSLESLPPSTQTAILTSLFARAIERICESHLPWLTIVFELARRRVTGDTISIDSRMALNPAARSILEEKYFDAVKSHAFAGISGRDLPFAKGVYDYFDAVNAHGDFAKLRVVQEVDELKRYFLNAPLVAAACAALSIPMNVEAALQLHDVESQDAPWFGDAFRWAYLYALSVGSQRDQTITA